MTAYVLMAKLRGDESAALAESQAVVQWLTRQRNPYGGFSSTQVCHSWRGRGVPPAMVQWLARQRNPYGGFSSTQVCHSWGEGTEGGESAALAESQAVLDRGAPMVASFLHSFYSCMEN